MTGSAAAQAALATLRPWPSTESTSARRTPPSPASARTGDPRCSPGCPEPPTTPSVVLFAGPQEYVVGEGARREARLDPEHVCALVKRRMGDAEWRFVAHGTAWSAPAVSSLILKSLVADAGLRDRRGAHRRRDHRARLLRRRGAPRHRARGHLRQPRRRGGALRADRRRARLRLRPARRRAGPLEDRPRPCSSTTSAAAPSTPPSSSWPTGASRCSPSRATTSSAAPTGTSASPCTSRGASARRTPTPRTRSTTPPGPRPSCWPPNGPSTSSPTPSATEVVVTHDGARATVPLSRAELEEMTAPLLRRTLDLTRACLDEAARRGVAQVDRVLLVGGSSRMPAVAELLRRELDLDPQLHDPELAVARGAAIYGEKTELERMVAADLRRPRAAARRRTARRRPPRRPRRRLPPGRRRVRRAAGPGAAGGGDPRRHGRVPRLRRARGERRSSAGWR